MTSNDSLRLNDHKLFENFRKSLPKDIIKTQNVLTVNDGVLFLWDFQDCCVLTLNVKEALSKRNDNIQHQVLLPTSSFRFSVDLLRANSTNTLLVVAGPNGLLVLELPERCPPYGAFSNNKEIVYCRSHSLDEHSLVCNPCIEIRQVRFHPGSLNNSHLLVLTSDNTLKLYNIGNGSAEVVQIYNIGKRPKGVMPGTKSFFLGLFGETAVDFDFGQPEIPQRVKIIEDDSIINIPQSELDKDTHSLLKKFEHLKLSGTKSSDKFNELQWPVYLLDGIGSVSIIMINLSDKIMPKVKGPLPMWPSSNQNYLNEACAILCQPCAPPIICIATSNGTIMHSIVLPYDEKHDKLKNMRNKTKNFDAPDRAMYVFETLELELGLATTENLSNYCCPVFLHPNDSHAGEYFATHEAGVHYITVPAIDTLSEILNGPEDETLMEQLVTQPSSAEYLLCTKTASSNKINPVIGFSLYYDPTSTIMLLAKGQVISTLLLSFTSLPNIDDFLPENLTDMNTPLKKMLSEPFDLQIYKILKQASSQPILKLSESGNSSQQECYELLQRASKALREEHFKFQEKAYEEIEKRIKVLQMLKNYQINELIKLGKEKQSLQDKAEYLAEKYEDVADKQNDLRKRCEKLLVIVAQKKKDPSEAELKFSSILKEAQQKIKLFNLAMNRLKNQSSYQEVQMENWHKDQIKRDTGLASIQSHTIKTNLRDMTNQITDMINEVIEYKKQLGLN